MKFIKLLLPAILLFAFVCTTEAQIVVTSTTASTEKIPEPPKEKSLRQKGLVVRPEIGIGIGLNTEIGIGLKTSSKMHLNILGIANYQFNPYISLGGGAGLSYTNFERNFGQHFFSIPIYANIRGYFCNRKWSPYYDIKLGFNCTINQKDSIVDDNKKYTDINVTGFYADFGLGMQYKNYDFGIELYLYPVNYDYFYKQFYYDYTTSPSTSYYEWNFSESEKGFYFFSLGFKFAYNFQIQKK